MTYQQLVWKVEMGFDHGHLEFTHIRRKHTKLEEKGLEAHHSIDDRSLNVSNYSRENLIVVIESTKESTGGPESISSFGALQIPGVMEFSFCLLFVKLLIYTFLYWLPLYIMNVVHFSVKKVGDLSTLFDAGSIIGGILAGLISDYTGVVMLIFCGGLVNGSYALITTAVSVDLGTHKCFQGNAKALSTVRAIINGTRSVSAALEPCWQGLLLNQAGTTTY
ncbi:UNVERIFIED_CONTAM: hypothetical protein K2H54_029929 [Gekko kuhli]